MAERVMGVTLVGDAESAGGRDTVRSSAAVDAVSGADTASEATGRADRGRRSSTHWWASPLDAIAQREHVLVALMVIVMALSALAVYQATRADDAADDRLATLRIIEGEAARHAGYLQTVVAHDFRMLTQYCEAESSRQDAMVDLLAAAPDSARIASRTIMTRSLEPLLLGDRLAECASHRSSTRSGSATYDVARARQTLEYNQSLRGNAIAPPDGEDAALAKYGTTEQSLMTAGVLFALALALLVAVDMLARTDERPRVFGVGPLKTLRRNLLLVAVLAALAATVLLVTFSVIMPVDDGARSVTLAFLALLAATITVAGRWRIAPTSLRAPSSRPHWWSEVLGAGAIVVFSLAAVGLSSVSALEREANMRADALQASAHQLQQVGEQAALRDLAAVSITARFIAQSAEAAVLGIKDAEASENQLAALEKSESQLASQINGSDAAIREQMTKSLAPECGPAGEESAWPTPDPSALYRELAGERANIDWHVREYQEPALACDTAADIARTEGRVWARHGSWLTVALVVVGLAGFILSLAADSKREEQVSRKLRAVGVLGVGAGVLLSGVAIPDLLWRASLPAEEQVPKISAAVAAARIDACGEDTVAALDSAIAQFPGYGPAYDIRAHAKLCAGSFGDWWQLSSDAEPDAVQAAIADFDEAYRYGVSGAGLDLSAGFLNVLGGIQQDDESAIRDGLRMTDAAIAELERSYPATGTQLAPGVTLHLARFNRALAYAALGDEKTALADYRRATRCLAPEADCAGGGLLDRALIDQTILWALADLELLGEPDERGDEQFDRYRLELVDAPSHRSSDRTLDGASLTIYPQDAGVTFDNPPSRSTVIWYARWRPEDTWQVLQVPSLATMHPGGYLHSRPSPLGTCAPEAHYRADVYTGGARHPVYVEGEEPVAPPLDAIRVSTSRLGLSAIVPAHWTTERNPAKVSWCDVYTDHTTVSAAPTATLRDNGLDWHVGPDEDSGLTVRRIEGVVPDGDLTAFLQTTLLAWAKESRGVDAAALHAPAEGYFLGGAYSMLADAVDRHLRVAVAYEPYSWEASERGGTIFLVALDDSGVGGEADLVNLEWVSEIVMEQPQQPMPVTVAAGDGFLFEVSSAWDIEPEPGETEDYVFSATPPTANTYLYVYRSEQTTDVGSKVDDWVEELTSGRAGWDDVILESRRDVSVPGAVDAEWIEYSRDREGPGPDRWVAWELFASDGETITNMYVTAWEESVWNMQSTVENMRDSFELTD